MPGLLMLFGKKIDATRHKNFVPKIPFVGRFAYATKKIIPPIFLAVIIVAMLFANNCPYVHGFSYLKTTKKAVRAADRGQYDRYHVRLEQYGRRRSPGRGLRVGKRSFWTTWDL